jgi:uncharacterized protein YbjT (DUF2867 family)
MTKPTILITGATGNVGREVVRELEIKNIQFIVTGAKPNPKHETRQLDFTKPETYKPALAGIKQLFLVRPPALSDVKKYFVPFLDVCKELQVEHIVFLSLQGVENNSVTPHHKIEKYIQQIAIPYTFIRPSFFMQNLTTTHLAEIKRGEIYIPAGNGKTNFIDVRDIGAVIAKVLIEQEPHLCKAYEITGEQALSYYEVAELISQQAGRKVVYKSPNIIAFYFRKRKEGIPSAFIIIMIALYTVARLGKAGGTTAEFENLMHRKPISFEQFVADNRELFANAG